MKGSSGTHPLSVTMTNPLEPSSLHKPGQTRESFLRSLLTRPIRVALSVEGPTTEASVRSEGALYRKACKSRRWLHPVANQLPRSRHLSEPVDQIFCCIPQQPTAAVRSCSLQPPGTTRTPVVRPPFNQLHERCHRSFVCHC